MTRSLSILALILALAAGSFLGCSPEDDSALPVPAEGEWQPDPHAPPPEPPPSEEFPEPPKWGPAGRLEPASVANPYVNAAIGVAITKPDDWTWLPMTSMPDFASRTERVPRDEVVPEEWADPIRTPLIAMSSRPDPQWGRDPVVLLQARPLVGPPGLADGISDDPVRIAGAAVLQRGTQYAGFAVVEEAVATDVAGRPGAVIRIRYDVATPDGVLWPASERVWHTRRDRFFFYLNAILPENAGPEVWSAIDRIHDSLRIDP